MKKEMPKYILVYRCQTCGFDSGYTELDKPKCRYCNKKTRLTLESKSKLTIEAIAERLRASTDNMMKALHSAYETMPDDIKKDANEEFDPEKELLKAMAKAKSLRDKVHKLKVKKKTKKTGKKI